MVLGTSQKSPAEPYISERTHCPECKFLWRGEDILQCFLRKRAEGDAFYINKTDEEIRKYAESYGWTESEPRYFKHVIGIELPYGHPNRYDGISYWMCPQCKTTWNRFTGEKEKIPEYEDEK